MDGDGRRTGVWAVVLGTGWILMRLWCHLGLPSECSLPSSSIDVIANILVLLAFGTAQAWFCGILDEERFKTIMQSYYFLIIFLASGPVVSALQNAEAIPSVEVGREEFTDTAATLSIIFFGLVIVFIIWHLVVAWKELPGVALVSGVKSSETPHFEPNSRFGRYMISQFLVLVLFIVASITLYEDYEGWGYHYALLAWLLSLMAQFDKTISLIWLALTSGVFVQGIGAYGVKLLSVH